jgi:DNA-binding NtrC family response regulator
MNSSAGLASPADGTIAVLLVGPRDSRRYVLRGILAPPQWHIHEACTCEEAAKLLDRHRIGVTICDTDVRGGGWQALLGNFEARPEPPKLIVSSRIADERLWAEVLNLGGYDVLVQPFDRREVLRVSRMAWQAWQDTCRGRCEPAKALHVATGS